MDNHFDQNVCEMFGDFECTIGVNVGLEDVLPLISGASTHDLLQPLR